MHRSIGTYRTTQDIWAEHWIALRKQNAALRCSKRWDRTHMTWLSLVSIKQQTYRRVHLTGCGMLTNIKSKTVRSAMTGQIVLHAILHVTQHIRKVHTAWALQVWNYTMKVPSFWLCPCPSYNQDRPSKWNRARRRKHRYTRTVLNDNYHAYGSRSTAP